MVHGVIADQVAVGGQLAQKIPPRQILGPATHDMVPVDKKDRLQSSSRELFKYQRRSHKIWTVVEGEKQTSAGAGDLLVTRMLRVAR